MEEVPATTKANRHALSLRLLSHCLYTYLYTALHWLWVRTMGLGINCLRNFRLEILINYCHDVMALFQNKLRAVSITMLLFSSADYFSAVLLVSAPFFSKPSIWIRGQAGHTFATYFTTLGRSWVSSSSYDYRPQGMVTLPC